MNNKASEWMKWEVFRFSQNHESEKVLNGIGVRDVNTKEVICDNELYYPQALDEKYAHLIASAPELLQMLRIALEVGTGSNHIQERIQKLIAKAEGRA